MKYKILFGFFLLVLIGVVVALEIESILTFNNGLSDENITLTKKENITRYIDLPLYANIDNINLSVTAYNRTHRQNVTSNATHPGYPFDCTPGLTSVCDSVSGYGAAADFKYIQDNDLTTYVDCRCPGTCGPGLVCNYQLNYTFDIPFNASMIKMYYHYNSTVAGDTFGYISLLNASNNWERVLFNGVHMINTYQNDDGERFGYVYLDCPDCIENNSKLVFDVLKNILSSGASSVRLFEFHVFLVDEITNLTVEIDSNEWGYSFNYTGSTDQKHNIDLNTTVVNNILANGCNCADCIQTDSNCSLPVIFSSDTSGLLNLLLDNVSYSYGIDNCTELSTNALDFYAYEENNRTSMLIDVDGVFTYTFDFIDYYNFTVSYDDVTNFSVCIYPNWSTIYLDSYLQYEGLAGIKERYYLDNITITNTTQTVNLYNFVDNTDVSELKANLRTYYYAYYPNVIMQMQRFYPDLNSWITVQVDQSDEFGVGVFYVYQNEEDYRFNWIEDGILLDEQSNGASTAPLKFLCDSATECEETFVVGRLTDEQQYQALTYTFTYTNETGIVLLTWNDGDNVVDSIRLLVEQAGSNAALTICDTTIESASGSITCNVSDYGGIISAKAFRTASPADPFAFIRIDKTIRELYNALSDQGWTNEGTFFAFLILAVVAGFGVTSAAGSVIMGVVGIIVLWVFELTSFINIAFVVGGVALGLIVSYMVNR